MEERIASLPLDKRDLLRLKYLSANPKWCFGMMLRVKYVRQKENNKKKRNPRTSFAGQFRHKSKLRLRAAGICARKRGAYKRLWIKDLKSYGGPEEKKEREEEATTNQGGMARDKKDQTTPRVQRRNNKRKGQSRTMLRSACLAQLQHNHLLESSTQGWLWNDGGRERRVREQQRLILIPGEEEADDPVCTQVLFPLRNSQCLRKRLCRPS